jgi:hypothetical protein
VGTEVGCFDGALLGLKVCVGDLLGGLVTGFAEGGREGLVLGGAVIDIA